MRFEFSRASVSIGLVFGALACSSAPSQTNDDGGGNADVQQPEQDGAPPNDAAATDVKVSGPGTYAFTGGSHGLTAFDVGDTSNVQPVGTLGGAEVLGIAAAASGDRLYATRQAGIEGGLSSTLDVLDVSNPANIQIAGSAPLAHSIILESPIVLSNGHAFVGELKAFESFDLSQPTAPVHEGTLTVAGDVRGMAVSGTLAYLAVDEGQGKGGALAIVDVSTPSAPTIVSSTEVGHNVWGFALDGTTAYLVFAGGAVDADNHNILVFDVSDPKSPQQIAGLLQQSAKGIVVRGGYAYIAGPKLVVADVHDPHAPAIIGGAQTQYAAFGVASGIQSNVVMVVGGDNVNPVAGDGSLELFDIGTPASPSALGAYTKLQGNPYSAVAADAVQ